MKSFKPGAPSGPVSIDLCAFLAASEKILIEINITKTYLTLQNKAKGGAPKTVPVSIRLDCFMQLNDKNEICVQPFDAFVDIGNMTMAEAFGAGIIETDADNRVSFPGENKPYTFDYNDFLKFLINKILIPVLIDKITPLIPRFKIPDFQFMGDDTYKSGCLSEGFLSYCQCKFEKGGKVRGA